MATVDPTPNGFALYGSEINTWAGLTLGDDGWPTGPPGSGDRTVAITGTFGAGTTVLIEGSLDMTNWFTLRDPSGSLLSFSAAGLKAIMENVLALRPRVSAGDGSESITVTLLVRSPRNG